MPEREPRGETVLGVDAIVRIGVDQVVDAIAIFVDGVVGALLVVVDTELGEFGEVEALAGRRRDRDVVVAAVLHLDAALEAMAGIGAGLPGVGDTRDHQRGDRDGKEKRAALHE